MKEDANTVTYYSIFHYGEDSCLTVLLRLLWNRVGHRLWGF